MESPPADRFLAIYFQANKWWEPPERAAHGVRDDGDEAAPTMWESPQLGEPD